MHVANVMAPPGAVATRCLADVCADRRLLRRWPRSSRAGHLEGRSGAACVAAASILAKVTRDRIMCDLDTRYPEYAFAEHKGYCTPLHQERLDLFGPSATHRMRFVNVSRTTRVVTP